MSKTRVGFYFDLYVTRCPKCGRFHAHELDMIDPACFKCERIARVSSAARAISAERKVTRLEGALARAKRKASK